MRMLYKNTLLAYCYTLLQYCYVLVFAILETFVPLTVSLLLCVYIIQAYIVFYFVYFNRQN